MEMWVILYLTTQRDYDIGKCKGLKSNTLDFFVLFLALSTYKTLKTLKNLNLTFLMGKMDLIKVPVLCTSLDSVRFKLEFLYTVIICMTALGLTPRKQFENLSLNVITLSDVG